MQRRGICKKEMQLYKNSVQYFPGFFPEISVWMKQINLNFVPVSAGTVLNFNLLDLFFLFLKKALCFSGIS